VPFGVIRVISDTPGEAENISQYENFWTDAPQETFEALKSLLTALK
jgi:nucleoside phosphorylase